MLMIPRFRGAAIAALLCCLSSPLFAQEATLTGTIKDASDAIVPGATVTARDLERGTTAVAVSDQQGLYHFTLRPGSYRVVAELMGLSPAVHDRVEVRPDTPAVVDLTLSVSSLAESVSVTGSHIRTSGFEAMAPLQVESRAEIESSGVAAFADLFRGIPGNSGSEATSESQARNGQSQFNLRGLGYSSTLTLINGRRAAVSPISEDGSEFTDVNQFPLAMVERVEVLKDGASAIYGSDAVAGVVNVITRRGFTGIDISGGLQSASNKVGFANLAAGHRYGRGVVNVYATYYDQTGNDRTDFDWLVERVHGNGVLGRSQLINTNGSPSNYRLGGLNASGLPVALSDAAFADPNCEAAGGVFRIRDNGTTDRSQCLHNFADQVAVLPSTQRVQLFSELTHQLGSRAALSAEVSFSRNVIDTTRGPGTYANGTVVNGGGAVYIPASHPFNFFQRDQADPSRLVYIDPSTWNPAVNQAVDVVAYMRPLGVHYNGENAGKRRDTITYPRVGTTLDVTLGGSWTGSVSYQYARANFDDLQEIRFNADVLNGLITSGQFNPFGLAITNPTLVSPKDGRSVAENSQAVIDQFVVDSLDKARTDRHVVDVTATGNLFPLAGRATTLAVGAQFRHLMLDTEPDPLQGAGRGDTTAVQRPQHGTQNVTGAFAELAAPIGSAASTQFALRFEDYGRYGSTVNPKAAGTVALGSLARLRASFGTSFQAPTLFQTSTASTRAFLNDPVALINGILRCTGSTVSSGNVDVETLGDDNLKPQHSRNYNLGAVLTPWFGLQVSVDYWNYRYRDLIAAAVPAQAIVTNDCRDGIPDDPRIERGPSGSLNKITNSFVNVGRVNTNGLDLAIAHRWTVGAAGMLSSSLDATWLRNFDVIGGEGGVFDGAGSRNFVNNFRTMPRWRGVAGVDWLRTVQRAGVRLRYIGNYKNDAGNNAIVDDYMPVDLSYGYTFTGVGRGAALTVMVGVDNAFDLDPPALRRNDASGRLITSAAYDYIDRPGYDAYSGADLRGRVVWLRLMHRF